MKSRCAHFGPTAWAQRAGQMPSKVAKAGRVRFVRAALTKRVPTAQTIDMFDGV